MQRYISVNRKRAYPFDGSQPDPAETARAKHQQVSGGRRYPKLTEACGERDPRKVAAQATRVAQEIAKAEKEAAKAQQRRAFVTLCEKHSEFLRNALGVDQFLIAMAYVYLKRAKLSQHGFTRQEYLFYALHLAIETEEDEILGITEIFVYLYGRCPEVGESASQTEYAKRFEWERNIQEFIAGKNVLWRKLNYRTWVTKDKCLRVLRKLPRMPFTRQRSQDDLTTLYVWASLDPDKKLGEESYGEDSASSSSSQISESDDDGPAVVTEFRLFSN